MKKEIPYIYPKWGTTVRLFEKTGEKWAWLKRFRVEYFYYLNSVAPASAKLKNSLYHSLGFLSLSRYIFIKNVISSKTYPANTDVVLVLADNAAFLKVLLPIAEELQNRGVRILLLGPSNHLKALKQKLPDTLRPRLAAIEACPVKGGPIFKFLKLLSAIILANLDALRFLMQPIPGRLWLFSSFSRYALTQRYYAHPLKHWFKQRKRFLLAANDYWMWESLLFTSTKGTATASAQVQHGLIGGFHDPFFADRFFVWGQNDIHLMIGRMQADPSRFKALGSPVMDKVWQRVQDEHLKKPREAKKIICFLAQPYYKTIASLSPVYKEALNWFVRYATEHAGQYNFALRLHPQDEPGFYDFVPSFIERAGGDLVTLLSDSRVMITVDSTAMLEAALAGTPCIQALSDGGKGDFVDYSDKGIALAVYDHDSFKEKLDALTSEDPAFYEQTLQHANRALEAYFANLGTSVPAIADEIIRTLADR